MAGNYSVGLSPMDTAMVMQAMQTPTPYGAYPMYTAPADKTYVAQPKLIDTTLTAPATETEEKSSSFGTVGVIGTVGAAALCVAGFKKGNPNKKMFSRVCDGIGNMTKGLFNGAKGKLTPKHPAIRKNNGEYIVSLPGKKNIMKGGEGVTKLGYEAPTMTPISEITTVSTRNGNQIYKLNKGNELLRFGFKNGDNTVICSNGGKTIQILDQDRKNITSEIMLKEPKVYEVIKEHRDNVLAGKVNFAELDNVLVKNTDATTGLVSRINYKGDKNGKISSITSDWFHVDDAQVNAYRCVNKSTDEIIGKVVKGETKGLTTVTSEVEVALKMEKDGSPVLGKFIVDSKGTPLEFVPNVGKSVKAGEENFLNLQFLNKEQFEEAAKSESWINPIYNAA